MNNFLNRFLISQSIEKSIPFYLGVLITLLAAYLAFKDKLGSSTICFVAGLLLLAFGNLGHFVSIKGLGFEAKMREIDQKIDEADVLLDKLRTLSKISGKAVVDLASRAGRWDSHLKNEEIYTYVKAVQTHLTELGVDDNGCRITLEPWVYYASLDLVRYAINDGLLPAANSEAARLQAAINEFAQTDGASDQDNGEALKLILADVNNWMKGYEELFRNRKKFDADTVVELFDKATWLNADAKEKLLTDASPWISELKHLPVHLDLLDKQAWFARG